MDELNIYKVICSRGRTLFGKCQQEGKYGGENNQIILLTAAIGNFSDGRDKVHSPITVMISVISSSAEERERDV